jgi:hypothetical protein
MKKAILVAAMLVALSQGSYGADWQYDSRRCAVGHVVGDLYFRIWGEYPVEFDIMKDRDGSGVGFRVASVRIDRADFPARESDTSHYILGLTEPLLRALARGKRLQVFAEGEAEPVADLRIGRAASMNSSPSTSAASKNANLGLMAISALKRKTNDSGTLWRAGWIQNPTPESRLHHHETGRVKFRSRDRRQLRFSFRCCANTTSCLHGGRCPD